MARKSTARSPTVEPSRPISVHVELPRPLPVRVEKPSPEPVRWRELVRELFRNRVTWALISLSALSVFLGASSPPRTALFACGNGPSLAVQYPTRLFSDQAGALDLSLENRTTALLTGTMVVRFDGLPIRMEDGYITALEVKGLPPGSSEGFRLSFRPHVQPFQGGQNTISLTWVAEGETVPCLPPDGSAPVVHTWPLPLSGLVRWLRAAPLSLLAQALWEWLKQRMME